MCSRRARSTFLNFSAFTPEEEDENKSDTNHQDQRKPIAVRVYPHDENRRSKTIMDGRVECDCFPFIILTSNGERELPAAFRRRCLSLDIEDPKGDRLRDIVIAHIKEATTSTDSEGDKKSVNLSPKVIELIEKFEGDRSKGSLLATDQLLNAVYLITRKAAASGDEWKRIEETVLRELRRK